MNIELEIKDIKHDLNYAKKCEYDHVTLNVYKVQALLSAYEKSKGLEEKIKNYINIIQKELDKYKIKNTNTYIQIEGNLEINGLLIQKATLEELIKELEKE